MQLLLVSSKSSSVSMVGFDGGLCFEEESKHDVFAGLEVVENLTQNHKALEFSGVAFVGLNVGNSLNQKHEEFGSINVEVGHPQDIGCAYNITSFGLNGTCVKGCHTVDATNFDIIQSNNFYIL